jgi:hypothetical protein
MKDKVAMERVAGLLADRLADRVVWLTSKLHHPAVFHRSSHPTL